MATAADLEIISPKDGTVCQNNESVGDPLDTQEIIITTKNGLPKSVPALHIGFMEVRTYISYRVPPNSIDNQDDNLSAEEEEWIDAMTFFVEDLHWLLQLPYHRFWSQVVYDENLHRFLESYLFQAYRDYDVSSLCIKNELSSLLKEIHKLVFLVFLRMSTYKESKEHHMRPQAFADMIYDCFLFDVPKIMDLCVIYGFHNQPLLSKMVKNIFITQPKYMIDLSEASQSILEAFSRVEEKLFINLPENSNGCLKLEEKIECGLKKLTIESFSDVINYITDISGTLYAFLEIHPSACELFFHNGAVNRISTFYEQVFPALEKEIGNYNQMTECKSVIEDIKQKIVLSKSFLIKLFRNILNVCGIESVLNSRFDESGKNSMKFSHAENFLEIFFAILSEKTFLHDYNAIFPFDADLELFNEMEVHLDPDRLNYIFSSIHDCPEMFTENFSCNVQNGARPKQKIAKKEKKQNGVKSFQSVAAVLKPEYSEVSEDILAECKKESEKCDEIQRVLDVFPNLGEGFVEKCLEHYNFNIESVIDALLSDSLPKSLRELDQTLQRNISSNSSFQNSSKHSILSERHSIFDNDEFDVFSRNEIDLSKVHKGKKNKTPNQYQILEKDEEFLKQLILTYGSEETEDSVESNVYEDEYDDTYDSAMVGLKETFIEDEPDDPSEQVSEEKNEAETKRNHLDFCINPEILRQKAEERRISMNAARNKNSNKNSSANSEHERQQKDRHKSQRGNHNRRKQADFKRSKGMF